MTGCREHSRRALGADCLTGGSSRRFLPAALRSLRRDGIPGSLRAIRKASPEAVLAWARTSTEKKK